MRPKRDVGWRQLCSIATAQLHAEGPFPVFRPTGLVDDQDRAVVSVDWFEWAERIKCRLVRLRLNYPEPHHLTKAMEATHRAWQKREGLWDPPRTAEERRRARALIAAQRARQRRHPTELPNVDPPWPSPRRPPSTDGHDWTIVGNIIPPPPA